MPKRFKHKYFSVRTEVDGINFHSKKEANYYKVLLQMRDRGDLLFFLRQVPLHLPGGVKYVVDFVEFWAPKFGEQAGVVKFVDVKGMVTPSFTMKKKMVESLYPIEIEVVK